MALPDEFCISSGMKVSWSLGSSSRVWPASWLKNSSFLVIRKWSEFYMCHLSCQCTFDTGLALTSLLYALMRVRDSNKIFSWDLAKQFSEGSSHITCCSTLMVLVGFIHTCSRVSASAWTLIWEGDATGIVTLSLEESRKPNKINKPATSKGITASPGCFLMAM